MTKGDGRIKNSVIGGSCSKKMEEILSVADHKGFTALFIFRP